LTLVIEAYTSPRLWNQLPDHFVSLSSRVIILSSIFHVVSLPVSASITSSLYHSTLHAKSSHRIV